MLRAGLVQMRSGRDMARNLADAGAAVREAAARGAHYVLTPEVTNIFEPDRERLKAEVRMEGEDICVRGFSALAQDLSIWLHVGSLALRASPDKLANRSLIFAPDGTIAARYDKIHLFDIDLPGGESHRESATFTAGQDAVTTTLPFAKLGLCICYDVRFPRLANAHANAGATVLTYPAAFTVPTGEAHWHVLLRARAIETGSFVLAAAQGGLHESGRSTYGHSLVIDPWGRVLAEAGTDPEVLVQDIDPAAALEARQRIPALRNARDFALKEATGLAK